MEPGPSHVMEAGTALCDGSRDFLSCVVNRNLMDAGAENNALLDDHCLNPGHRTREVPAFPGTMSWVEAMIVQ